MKTHKKKKLSFFLFKYPSQISVISKTLFFSQRSLLHMEFRLNSQNRVAKYMLMQRLDKFEGKKSGEGRKTTKKC